jgi:hypothetical protein
VKSDRRVGIFTGQSERRLELQAKLAILHFEIDREMRNP